MSLNEILAEELLMKHEQASSTSSLFHYPSPICKHENICSTYLCLFTFALISGRESKDFMSVTAFTNFSCVRYM